MRNREFYILSCLVYIIILLLVFWVYLSDFNNIQITNGPVWILNRTTQVYEIQGKPPLWLYWNNLITMPPHICLSLKTLHCHNRQDFSLKLVTKATAKQYIADFHPAFDRLIPAHQADYVRCRVLQIFGGMYVDVDIVALRSFKEWYDYLTQYDIIGYSWKPDGDKIGIGTLGPVRAHHPLFLQYRNVSHLVLNRKFTSRTQTDVLRWAELLREIIVPEFHKLLEKNMTHALMFDGPSTVGQIVTQNPMRQVNESVIQALNTTVPYLMYPNSMMAKSESEQQILNSTTLLGRLFKIALEAKNCGVIPSCSELQRLYS